LFASNQEKNLQDIIEFGSPISTSINLILLDVISCTGLQIRFDPGTFVIYFGFGLLIVSAFVSYSSYSRIWIITNPSKLKIIGVTNRSKQGFTLQILKLINSIF
jgi:cytochrome c biogenesis protein ResB